MTINSVKNRIDRLSKSKPHGIHLFVIDESTDSQEKKTEILHHVKLLEAQGEIPLVVIIRALTEPCKNNGKEEL